MGACCSCKENLEGENISQLDTETKVKSMLADPDYKPYVSSVVNRQKLNQSERDLIDIYSDEYFKAFNHLRRHPNQFLSLANEYGIEYLFKMATVDYPAAQSKLEFFKLAKEKIINIFNDKKDFDDAIDEFKNMSEFKDFDVDIYFGRDETTQITPDPQNDEWQDVCRRGVCDIFSRYAKEENLLAKRADYATFVCIVDELKSAVNTVLIIFNSKQQF